MDKKIWMLKELGFNDEEISELKYLLPLSTVRMCYVAGQDDKDEGKDLAQRYADFYRNQNKVKNTNIEENELEM